MEPKLNAHYLEVRAALARLPDQAERGWLIDQAAAARPRRSRTAPVRRWVGAALIAAGERVQGPVLVAIGNEQHHAPVQDA